MQLNIRQAATYFGVGEAQVRRWIADRELPAHRVNERLHLNAIEVWEWAVERGIPVSRSLLDEARRSPEPIPPLAGLLARGGVHRDIEGHDKSAVLASIVGRLPLPEEVDRGHLLAVLEAREAMGSTGVGGGIAIPHVRNPILLHVDGPLVSLFFLRHPVDFESMDGEPVHAVFLVVTSSIPVHLRILAELGFVLRDPTLREMLRTRDTGAHILDRLTELAGVTTGQHSTAPPP